MSVADDFELSPREAGAAILKLIAVVNHWQLHFRSLGVTEPDIAELAAHIDAPDLLAQRRTFSIDPYVKTAKPRRGPSPGAKAFR
jgi:hypothetical protein